MSYICGVSHATGKKKGIGEGFLYFEYFNGFQFHALVIA